MIALLTIILSLLLPCSVYAGTPMVEISAGNHFVGVASDGKLYTWGLGGAMGYDEHKSITQVGIDTNWSTNFMSTSEHVKAIKTTGAMYSWGKNEYGQLGLGDKTDRPAPTLVPGGKTWSKVSKANYHGHAIDTDGKLWGAGRNQYGQVGSIAVLGSSDITSFTQIGTGTNWASATGGNYFTVAIKTDGTMWGWGLNDYGQCGVGDKVNRTSGPVQIGSGNTWSKVNCGSAHCMAIKTDGTLWGWGLNWWGTLGDGTSTDQVSPVQIGSSAWSDVAAGVYYTLGIKSDGTLWAWGFNDNGQVGNNDPNYATVTTPTKISTESGWLKVSTTYGSSMALKSGGAVFAWGYGGQYNMGNFNTANLLVPTRVPTYYYVDYVAGVDSNTGRSTTNPWKHCPGDGLRITGVAAATTLMGGDRIIFKGNTQYTTGIGDNANPGGINMLWSGLGDADPDRIIFDGDSGTYADRWAAGVAKAIIDGNKATFFSLFYSYENFQRSYITINNFVLRNANDVRYDVNGIVGIIIWYNRKVSDPSGDYITISNNDFSSCGHWEFGAHVHGSCISQGLGNYWKIYNNTFTDSPTTGSDSIVILNGANSEFYSNVLDGVHAHWPLGIGVGGVDVTSIANNTIHHNTFKNAGKGMAPSLLQGTTPANIAHWNGSYYIGGTNYVLPANLAGVAPGTDVIVQNKFGAVALDVGTDGGVHAIPATNQAAAQFTTAVAAGAALPAVAANHVRLGYITVKNSSGSFTFGTTSFSESGVLFEDHGEGGHHSDWIYIYSDLPYYTPYTNLQIYSNKFYNDYSPPDQFGQGFITLQAYSSTTPWDGIYIYNNMMFNGSTAGVVGIGIGCYGGGMHNLYLLNNTIHQPAGSYGDLLGLNGGTYTNLTIKNNILSTLNGGYIVGSYVFSGTVDISDNFYYNSGGQYRPFTHNGAYLTWPEWKALGYDAVPGFSDTTTDPVFTSVTPASFNLALTASSPATIRTGGANLGSPYNVDILGIPRGTGNWSYGAYQYSGATGDVTAPSVSITTANPSTITSNSLEVNGTASDAVGVVECKYRVGLPPNTYNGTTCAGDTAWACFTSGDYAGGANTLYVGCRDAAFNWGSSSIVVNYTPAGDSVAPAVVISTASPQAINTDYLVVTGTASDAVGVSGCKWMVATEPTALQGNLCTGSTAWTCNTSGYSAGGNNLYIECYDAIPNYSTGHSIIVNYTPPPVEGVEAHSLYIRGGKIE